MFADVCVLQPIQFMHFTQCAVIGGLATTIWDDTKSPKATDIMHRGLFKQMLDMQQLRWHMRARARVCVCTRMYAS
jgi:hypothetical protein